MRQVLQDLKSGKVILEEVPCPNAGQGMVLIETSKSLISAGTERMLVEFSRASLIKKARSQPEKVKQVLDKIKTDGLIPTMETVFSKLDEPMPMGYCNAGKVLSVGPGVHDLQTGDRVVSNGPHAEIVSVPRNLVARIPGGVDDETAAFTVLGAVGLQGIRLAEPTLGERFMVFGTGLLGLMTLQMLQANGCLVMAVDVNRERLKIAESFGAETVNVSAGGDPVAAALSFSGGKGVDGVIICASAKNDEIMHQSASVCRKRGRIVLVGVVGLNLRRDDFYKKELTFQISCSYGPGRYDESYEQSGHDYPYGYVRWTEGRNFEAVLEMMDKGTLDVKTLITHRFPLEKVQDAYEKIQHDRQSLGVILEYPEKVNHNRQVTINLPDIRKEKDRDTGGRVVAGVIGAGSFASGTILPALAKTGVRLKYVAGNTNPAGLTHTARKFRAEQSVTDFRTILDDSEVNTVFIVTRHDTHARFVIESLQAGKNVFVEKPLCLNENELDEIRNLYEKTDSTRPLLMVGFNRRFSLHTMKIKEIIKQRSGPLCMSMTVNAGDIPPEHWTQNPDIGGGRIIGEGCHFIDLLSFIAGVPVVQISAIMVGEGVIREDKIIVQMGFADGSIGTVNYFANGSKSYPKEILELFCDGWILRLENFRETTGYGFKNFRRFRTRRQDKGHIREIAEFVRCVENGGNAPILLNEMVNVTKASFAAVESAKNNKVISISP